MIEQIKVWQMLVDVSLVGTILFIAIRWMKSSQAQALLPRTMELEGSLRNLIKEADAAGRHLNDQLLRREQTLQKILSDVEEGEQRLTRYIADGEDRTKSIQLSVEMAREVIAELQECVRQARGALDRALIERRQWDPPQGAPSQRERAQRGASRYERPVREEYYVDEGEVDEVVWPERGAERMPERSGTRRYRQPIASDGSWESEQEPGGRRGEQRMPERMAERLVEKMPERSAARRYQPQVKYAGPSDSELAMVPEPAGRRAGEPRPERAAPQRATSAATGESRGMQELQRIYATAEDMIKQGQELEQVCAQTKLPVEEVRLLSQMVEVERDEEERQKRNRVPAGTDPRLGALGAIRRQTTTV